MKEKMISDLLVRLNFTISSIGFKYWIDAIKIYNPKEHIKIETLYHDIAGRNNTTRQRVERAMRTARIRADKELYKEFNYNQKLSNKVILLLLVSNYNICGNIND